MPYKNGEKWRGKVTHEGQRYTKSFKYKRDALRWESQKRKELKRICSKTIQKDVDEFKEIANDLDELKEKYHRLYKNPYNTLADIFNSLMRDIDLPFRYKDLLNLAKIANDKRNEKVPTSLRVKVLKRDNFTCKWCGASNKEKDVKLHIDHIIPKSKGGITEERNLQTLCRDCNLGKNNKFFYFENQKGT